MKKLLSFLFLLLMGVLTSACVNTFAVHELNENAVKFIQKGDYESALSRLQAALDLDKEVYETQYNLAVASLGLNDCENALKYIVEAYRLDENNPDVFYTKGVTYDCFADKTATTQQSAQINEDEQADVAVIDPSALDKETRDIYVDYLTKAIECYETFLKMNPKSPEAGKVSEGIMNNRAKIEQLLAQDAEAIQE